MESKKINQLATELTPALSDLTIIGDPTTGISKKITLSQMASLFTGTVEEYANLAAFPLVGVADTIYIALDTNVLYRWDTGLTSYVELSPNIINSLVFNDANGFDGTIALVGSTATLTITTALTTGSVGFIGASGALLQDNANFFWDDTNNRLGVGTNAPTTPIDVFGSGIIGRLNGTSTNNAFLGFASAGSNKWSIGNVQSDHRFRIYNEATTSELVSVLSTGEFGIGIANPTTKLHIDGGASALIANLDANVSVAKSISFRSDNSNRINLEVSGTESGSNAGANFYLRTYTDAGALINTPLTIIRSTGAATFSNAVGIGATAGTNGLFEVSNLGTGVTVGDFLIDAANKNVYVGRLSSTSNDNTNFIVRNRIGTTLFYVTGNTGYIGIGTSTPGSLLTLFDTTTPKIAFQNSGAIRAAIQSDSSSLILNSVTGNDIRFQCDSGEKVRITSPGFLKASNTGTYPYSGTNVHEIASSASDNTLVIYNSGASPSGIFMYYFQAPNNTSSYFLNFYDGNVSTQRFGVRSNGGVVNYQANNVNLSDERTKKEIAPLESYWNKFKNIEIVKFKYNDQTHDDFNIGVIAQQVEKIAPEFIDTEGWGKTSEDEEPLKSVYTADLHHATIKVLQEAMAKIELLEAKLNMN